jgi:protein-S-isoprenylcysteine O-methyltransferase Ste14
MIFRHLLSITILPFTVTVLVPWWLIDSSGMMITAPREPAEIALAGLGVILLAIGLLLFGTSLRRFASDGEGTLAPWDPPRKFVVTGPYRFVRNPMITGVVLMLFGEAALLRSGLQATWALLFLAGNFVVIPFVEEPLLRQRFGAPYDEYCRNVGRLIPRMTPWVPRDG